MITVDRDAESSAYRQIAKDVRDRITSGDLRGKRRLPSEKDLQFEYGVARDTIRRAIAVLTDLGLVRAVKGRGTFIRSVSVTTAPMEPGMRIFSRAATEGELATLDLAPGSWVLVIERAGGEVEVLPAESSEIRIEQ